MRSVLHATILVWTLVLLPTKVTGGNEDDARRRHALKISGLQTFADLVEHGIRTPEALHSNGIRNSSHAAEFGFGRLAVSSRGFVRDSILFPDPRFSPRISQYVPDLDAKLPQFSDFDRMEDRPGRLSKGSLVRYYRRRGDDQPPALTRLLRKIGVISPEAYFAAESGREDGEDHRWIGMDLGGLPTWIDDRDVELVPGKGTPTWLAVRLAIARHHYGGDKIRSLTLDSVWDAFTVAQLTQSLNFSRHETPRNDTDLFIEVFQETRIIQMARVFAQQLGGYSLQIESVRPWQHAWRMRWLLGRDGWHNAGNYWTDQRVEQFFEQFPALSMQSWVPVGWRVHCRLSPGSKETGRL